MEKLNNIVDRCIRQHVGGEEFFDALDMEIQDEEIIERLMTLVNTFIYERGYATERDIGFIVSGKFGEYFHDLMSDKISYPIVTLEGGLRHEISGMLKHLDLTSLSKMYTCEKWIFIDDSFYSGKTKEVIRRSLKSIGHKLLHTFVVYDGSPTESKLVSSLYRYYK